MITNLKFKKLNAFDEGTAIAVLAVAERFPLILHCSIRLQFRVALSPFETILVVGRDEVGEEECVYALALVLRLDCDEQQVDTVVFALQALEQMPPSEWEHLAL